jgi:hypothetical protein
LWSNTFLLLLGWPFSRQPLSFLKQIIMSKLTMISICAQVYNSKCNDLSARYTAMNVDIFSLLDRLATLLAKERTHSLTYIGCMKKGPVITDPKMKWYPIITYFLLLDLSLFFTVCWREFLLVA